MKDYKVTAWQIGKAIAPRNSCPDQAVYRLIGNGAATLKLGQLHALSELVGCQMRDLLRNPDNRHTTTGHVHTFEYRGHRVTLNMETGLSTVFNLGGLAVREVFIQFTGIPLSEFMGEVRSYIDEIIAKTETAAEAAQPS